MSLDNDARPHCVVVSIEAPWPVTTGGRARTAQIIIQLAMRYDVTVIYPMAEDEQIPEVPQGVLLRPVSASLRPTLADRLGVMPRLGKLALRAIKDDLKQALDEIDPIFIYWSHSYLAAVGMKATGQHLHVVEFANIEGERSLSISRSSKKFRHKISALAEYFKSNWWEPNCAKRASLVVSMHHSEAAKLRRYGAEVILVPNGFTQHEFNHSPSDSLRVLTMGSWDYGPNRAGLESFLNSNWPEITRLNPLMELVIAGKGAGELLNGIKGIQRNVTALGFVNDPSSIFKDCFCFLAPAITGGGSQLKVAEALSFHRLVAGPKFLQREVSPDMPENTVIGTEDLTQTILNLASSPEDRHSVEDNLQAYTSSRSWQQNFAPVQDWLAQAISFSGSRGRTNNEQ